VFDFTLTEVSYLLTCLKTLPTHFLHAPTTALIFLEEIIQSSTLLLDARITGGFPSCSSVISTFQSTLASLNTVSYSVNAQTPLYFISYAVNLESLYQTNTKSLEESSSQFRTQRSQNPVFKPDFKSGNFFTRDDFARKPFLLTTISDITKGMRRPA